MKSQEDIRKIKEKRDKFYNSRLKCLTGEVLEPVKDKAHTLNKTYLGEDFEFSFKKIALGTKYDNDYEDDDVVELKLVGNAAATIKELKGLADFIYEIVGEAVEKKELKESSTIAIFNRLYEKKSQNK